MSALPATTRFKRLLGSKTFLVLNLVFLVFITVSFGREFFRDYEARQEIKQLEAKEAELRERNFSVADLLAAIQTESFVEREARLKLGMTKPGEKTIIIEENLNNREENSNEAAAGSLDAFFAQRIANPVKWWYYFFDPIKFELLTSQL